MYRVIKDQPKNSSQGQISSSEVFGFFFPHGLASSSRKKKPVERTRYVYELKLLKQIKKVGK